MGMGAQGDGRRAFSDINITPLVDVMLVLLVVFMVTAPLLTSDLTVELPRVASEHGAIRDTKLIVTITRDERILFDDRDVTRQIDQVLIDSSRIREHRQLYVRIDKHARYEVIARVLAAARGAGVQGLNLLVEPELVESK